MCVINDPGALLNRCWASGIGPRGALKQESTVLFVGLSVENPYFC